MIQTNMTFSTSYKEVDYVLRARSPGNISREGLDGKYSSWWKGPCKIVGVVNTEVTAVSFGTRI